MSIDEASQTRTDAPPRPVYIRVTEACREYSLSRSKLYQMINAGKFRSVSLREPGQVRATRLINRASLEAYIDSLAEGSVNF
ncbi:helix-turn-helix transcriptional regulator [Luteolibacter flavescens]|uniref:helix-turn-helix transcriptional regulator n=1 Tax=Luteolibacter flavescens TaxID=1859460 RepID=UPI003CCDD904